MRIIIGAIFIIATIVVWIYGLITPGPLSNYKDAYEWKNSNKWLSYVDNEQTRRYVRAYSKYEKEVERSEYLLEGMQFGIGLAIIVVVILVIARILRWISFDYGFIVPIICSSAIIIGFISRNKSIFFIESIVQWLVGGTIIGFIIGLIPSFIFSSPLGWIIFSIIGAVIGIFLAIKGY